MKFRTENQVKYFDEVIRLYYTQGYGENKISKIIPVGHSTVSRWIAIFVSENEELATKMKKIRLQAKSKDRPDPVLIANPTTREQELEAENSSLKKKLAASELKSDAYDEMINVAEAMFNIPIRKKVGVKQ